MVSFLRLRFISVVVITLDFDQITFQQPRFEPGMDLFLSSVDRLIADLRGRSTVSSALEFAANIEYIMNFATTRALITLFSLPTKTVRGIIECSIQHPDFPLFPENAEQYATKRLPIGII